MTKINAGCPHQKVKCTTVNTSVTDLIRIWIAILEASSLKTCKQPLPENNMNHPLYRFLLTN